ncbi:MAG: COX15/CtaA family protein [Gammaproteobacteria bacterium]|nr:COX15/CtaA family protein [Gammaproteobacteria bacterium]
MTRTQWIRTIAAVAFGLCLIVVVLGAYVRLSDAGLGCPDWPGCYGHLSPIGAAADSAATAAYSIPLETGKAWREMIHRYAASTLGLLIVLIAALAWLWRREHIVAPGYAFALLAIVVVQGLFGMLTVTWLLKPLVVTLHLLFGLLTLSLLWWLVLTLGRRQGAAWSAATAYLGAPLLRVRRLAAIGLGALALQIALGGWTSSNYAAVACPDFPRCQGAWWPAADFDAAFVLWHGLGVNYEGGVLEHPARVAIHLTHRLGALLATALLLWAALAVLRLRRDSGARRASVAVLVTLALQFTIGASTVLLGFPLWLATAHNAGAALLLLATVALNRTLRPA